MQGFLRGAATAGREAIRELWEKLLPRMQRFAPEEPLPALVSGDIALTATVAKDGAGARAQVARRQPDCSWLRLLDLPETGSAAGRRTGKLLPISGCRPAYQLAHFANVSLAGLAILCQSWLAENCRSEQ